jgi:uncharacterized secreted protein with C-terminal beta-propeller domain
VQGTQLSLFDVHDPANPQRLSTLPIGGSSEAEWDHHAFLYWPEDGTIVLPDVARLEQLARLSSASPDR